MIFAETELESYKNKTEEDIRDVRQNIKDKVNKYIIKETGKRPVIYSNYRIIKARNILLLFCFLNMICKEVI